MGPYRKSLNMYSLTNQRVQRDFLLAARLLVRRAGAQKRSPRGVDEQVIFIGYYVPGIPGGEGDEVSR